MIPLRLIALAWCLLVLYPVASAEAQNGSRPKYKVDIQQGPAYARVTVTTDPAVPVKQTEKFQVVCRVRDYQGLQNAVYRDLEIGRGQTSGSTELYYLPSGEYWVDWDLLVHVEQDGNGRYDRSRDLCQVELDQGSNGYAYIKQTLVVSSQILTTKGQLVMAGGQAPARQQTTQVTGKQPIPNIKELNTYFGQFAGGGAGTTLLNNYSMFTAFPSALQGIPPSSLPTDWMGLYNVEMILISLPDLRAACMENPRVRDALRHWLAMGGNLVVNDCGSNLARAPRILPTLFGPESPVLPQQMQLNWAVPTQKLEKYISRDFSQMVNVTTSSDLAEQGDVWRVTEQLEKEYWAMAPYLRGHIFAVSDDMSTTTAAQWRELINAHNVLKKEDYDHDHRLTGFDRKMMAGFEIPSVGDPPVFAFQFLLALFVIIVGPVFFLLFRRAKKMHLLLFATPLLSLVACFGMFLFAILNDGFGRQGRVHTVTFLDQSTGDGVTFGRHAFYAGTAPTAYLFGGQTLVMDSRRDYSPVSHFRYQDDQCLLSGGEIKPRIKHQVVTHQPIETEQRINLTGGQPAATMENRMDTEVILFCAPTAESDELGFGWQVARNVPAGQAARCEGAELPKLRREIRSLLEQRSVPAKELEENFSDPNYNPSLVSIPTGRSAERWIGAFLEQSWGATDIAPGQYIAILKKPLTPQRPDAEVDYKTYELHIVIGKL